jgi:hypothetical protein
VERADIAGLTNALREAFVAAGKDVEEKRTVTGSAFFTSGHAIGQYEVRANVVRARLWLGDKERKSVETRPTFDPSSGWLHVVSNDDVAFVRGLAPAAYKGAASGAAGAAPPAPRVPAAAPAAPWKVEPAVAEPKSVAATGVTATGEKKKGAVRRPSSST